MKEILIQIFIMIKAQQKVLIVFTLISGID